MHQETTINSHRNISNATIYHKIANNMRSKSADYPRTTSTIISSAKTRSTTIIVDEFHRTTETIDEKHGLNLLNNRFENYLDKIKNLANININLHHQIDNIYQTYMQHIEENKEINNKNSSSLEIQLNNLHQQLNNELQKLTSFQIHLQRADHDKKYYKNKLKIFSISNQYQILKQQFDANLYELNFLKEQYEKQEQHLQLYKKQYNEYMKKLIEYTNEYNNIIFERIQSENLLYTLKEELSFERKYNQQCQQEFKYLEKIQYDLNNQFNKIEFENIIKQIREDYQKYNEIQLSELEISYKTKLNSIKNDFYLPKKDDHSEEIKSLIEQNKLLQQKLKQLEYDLHHIIEQNQQEYQIANDEYNQLEIQISEYEYLILHSRNNTVHLSSEINTYQCLLINLISSEQQPKLHPYIERITGFTVHLRNGLILVRI